MGWTKLQVVSKAFGVSGLAQDNMAVEDLLEGLSSLDAMVASWETRGIRLGYLTSPTPQESDLAQDSGLPNWAVRAVYLNLGIELAATNGRDLQPEIHALAAQALDGVRIKCCKPGGMKLGPGIPSGGGNRQWRFPGTGDFIVEDDDEIAIDSDSELEFK